MRRIALHATALALLGLIAVAAGTGVAKAASALEHACCAKLTEAGDDSPCHGFLPLSCCDEAALPATAASATCESPVSVLAVPLAAVAPPGPARPAPHLARHASAPRAVPLLRSVVLQV